MKLQDLDDLAPPAPDGEMLRRVYARSTRLRARRRIGVVTAAVIAVLIVGIGVALLQSRTEQPRVATRVPAAAGPVEIAGRWKPRSAAGYTGPIDNYRWRIAPFLHFDGNGRWTGADGCNDLGGSYDIGTTGAFHASAEGGTTVRCDPPFFPTTGIVRSTARIVRNDDELTFVDTSDRVVALYVLVPNKSQSSDWTQEVHDVRKGGQSAYVSQPLNIKHPGHYTLVFGPLSAADIQRFTTDKGYGISFADDQTFDGNPDEARLERFVQNGKVYLRMPMTVTAVHSEYDGFRVLLQF